MIITINISKEEIELIEAGDLEAAAAAAELYRYTLLQAAAAAHKVGEGDGPTNYFVISPPYDVKHKAKVALCVPHPQDYPNSIKFNMNEKETEKDGISRPEVKTDIPNAFKNITWNEEGNE